MPCITLAIAPHIHVLYRDIPFILNIKVTPRVGPAGLKKGLGLGEITDSVIRLRGADLTVLNSHII